MDRRVESRVGRGASGGRGAAWLVSLAGLAAGLHTGAADGWWCAPAAAQRIGWGGVAPQGENPVFVADSPAATEMLLRVGDHVRSGNLDQAAVLVQQLLDDEAWSLVPSAAGPGGEPADAAVYVSVRSRVAAMLLETPALLARYRLVQEARAAELLAAGDLDSLVRGRWLTRPGLEGLLREAQRRLESGRFAAAWTVLAEVAQHPDCAGGEAAGALELARTLERYGRTDAGTRAVVAELARRAGADPGAPPPGAPVKPPASAVVDAASALAGLSRPVDMSTVVPRPLATTVYDPAGLSNGAVDAGRGAAGGFAGGGMGRGFGDEGQPGVPGLPEGQRQLRTFPVLVGDVLVIGGGNALVGLDRYTLSTRWRYEGEPSRRSPGRSARWDAGALFPLMENVSSVSAAPGGDGGTGGVVLAVLSSEGLSGEGTQRLVALDALTGVLRWSKAVAQLSPELSTAVVRGPVLVGEGVAVLSLRRAAGDRRMTGAMLAGVELSSGELKWTRLLGSAGSLPYYSQPARVSDAATIDGGVVYRSDRVGVVGAYAAEDGRPLWVRRLAAEPLEYRVSPTAPFQMSWPVIVGEHLFVLTPDRTKLLRLDRNTGSLTGQVQADRLMNPAYLVGCGDRVAAVGENRVAVFEAEKFGEAMKVDVSPTFAPPGIRGRVVAARTAGGAAGTSDAPAATAAAAAPNWVLLVPLPWQVVLVRADRAEDEPAMVRLDQSGNVLAVEDQLLVTDDARAHSYLSWDGADRVLTARMATDEDDPTAAATLAEIAARSGKPARVLFAAERAAQVIAQARGGDRPAIVDRAEQQRRRLMTTLVGLVRRAQTGEGGAGGAGGAGGEAGLPDVDQVSAMVARIGELATGNDERAVHRLLLARHAEVRQQWDEAVAGYQAVIEDAALSAASTSGVFAAARAGEEATSRIEAVLASQGRRVYAAYDARAAAKLAELGAEAPSAALVELARAFPGWQQGPGAYLLAAQQMTAPGDARARARLLEQGLQAARRIGDANPASVAELGGLLVESFRQRGLSVAARQTISRLAQRYPGLVLTVAGAPLETNAAAVARAAVALPAVGAPVAAGQEVLERMVLVEPALGGPESAAGRGYVVVQDAWGGLAMLAPPTGADAGMAMRRVWQSALTADPVRLLRADAEGVIVATVTESGTRLMRVGADGSQVWESAGLTREGATPAPELKGGEEPAVRGAPRPAMAGDPGGAPLLTLDGLAERGEVLVAGDEGTLALVERTGRFVLVDAQTGEMLYTGKAAIGRVTDAGLLGDLLVVGGELEPENGAGGAWRPAVAMIESRSGRAMRTVTMPEPAQPPAGGANGAGGRAVRPEDAGRNAVLEVPGLSLAGVRWVRLTERGEVIVAWSGGLSAVDPQTGAIDWTLPASSGPAATGVDAWLADGRLVVMGEDRSLWLLDLEAGAGGGAGTPVAMETAGRIGAGDEVWVSALPPAPREGGAPGNAGGSSAAGFVLRTTRGVVVFGPGGELVAADGLGGGQGVLMPTLADGAALVLSRTAMGARAVEAGGGGGPGGVGGAGAEGEVAPGVPAGQGVYWLHELSTATGVIRRSTAISLPRAPSRVAVLPGRVLITVGRSTVVLAAPATP